MPNAGLTSGLGMMPPPTVGALMCRIQAQNWPNLAGLKARYDSPSRYWLPRVWFLYNGLTGVRMTRKLENYYYGC